MELHAGWYRGWDGSTRSYASACNTDTTPTHPPRNSNTQRTKNNMTNVVIRQNSHKLLMMDILMSETCWAHKKWNEIASDIKLVFYSSTICTVFFVLSSLFNTKKIVFSFSFSFCMSLIFHGRGIPCQSPAVVGEHSTVPRPLISLLHWRNVLMETFPVFTTHCTTSSLGKYPNASEGSLFLLTCCSLIYGSSAKGCLQAAHSFEPFCFPKILLLQI